MYYLYGFLEIEQSSFAGFTIIIMLFEFSAEFIAGGVGMVMVVYFYDFYYCCNYPVNLTTVGFNVLVFILIIEYTEVDYILQVVVPLFCKENFILQIASTVKIVC